MENNNKVFMRIVSSILQIAGFIASSYFTYNLMHLLFNIWYLSLIMTILVNVFEVFALVYFARYKNSAASAYVSLVFCVIVGAVSIFSSTLAYQAGDARIQFSKVEVDNSFKMAANQDSLFKIGAQIAEKQKEKGYLRNASATVQALLSVKPNIERPSEQTLREAGVQNSFILIANNLNFQPGSFRFWVNLFVAGLIEFILLFCSFLNETVLSKKAIESFERSGNNGATSSKKNYSTGSNGNGSTGVTKFLKKLFNLDSNKTLNYSTKKDSTENDSTISTNIQGQSDIELKPEEISELKKLCRNAGKSDPFILALWEKGYRNKSLIGRIAGNVLKGKRKIISSTYVSRVLNENNLLT